MRHKKSRGHSLSRTEIKFYLTTERNTISIFFLSEPIFTIKALSETSTPYTPTSTSTTVTGNETVSLTDEIKKYDTAKLIEYLQGQKNLELSEMANKISEKEELDGGDLFDLTEEKLDKWGCQTKKELGEVLRKYGIDSNEITKILLFEPEPVEIDDEDEELEQCIILEIKRRMGIIGSATGRNEAVRCDHNRGKTKGFGSGIHAEYNATRKFSPHKHEKRKASVSFDEFDYLYGIVTTASDWYFLMYTPERIYCSKDDYHIVLNEKIMKDDVKLRLGVKKVMEVIVDLLKDRVEVDDSPDSKRPREFEGEPITKKTRTPILTQIRWNAFTNIAVEYGLDHGP
ncbi:unnamed protein product [Rhizophagus irregularis]|nr:unnamed protein product [Rhizophagus irregularis]